jgi:hypothetical protein
MRISPSKSRLIFLCALLSAAMLAVMSTAASADVGEKIIQRCTHGESLGGFSQHDYSRALKELSADAEEYTDCSSLIRKAQASAAAGNQSGGGSGPTSGSSGTTAALATSPSEQRSVARAASTIPRSVNLNGQVIHPGVVHTNVASALSSLPTPLFATLAFLLACLLLVAGGALRNRIRAGRSD